MSHPLIDPTAHPARVLGKLAMATADVEARPEAYTDEILLSYRRAAMRLAAAAGAEYTRRTMPVKQ